MSPRGQPRWNRATGESCLRRVNTYLMRWAGKKYKRLRRQDRQDRPNPIGLHPTTVTAIDGTRVGVAHLEAVDGTPVLDIKPLLGPPPGR